jgi:hypothetical protein
MCGLLLALIFLQCRRRKPKTRNTRIPLSALTKTLALAAALSIVAAAKAGIIDAGVQSNFCQGASIALSSSSIGPYSGSCASANSTFTLSANTAGSGLTFADSISATDSSFDPNASGNYGIAYEDYQEEVTISTAGYLSLVFDIAGTESNVNGYYADYNILATLYPYDNGNDYFAEPAGDGPGQVTLQLQDPVAAGTYLLTIEPEARLNFIDCTCDEPPAGTGISDSASYTFQLVGVTDSNGGTVIGADGTNFTALSSAPEPNSLMIGLGGMLIVLGRLRLTSRRRRS